MSDLINRQDTIDAFWKLDVEIRPSAIDAILDMINTLPSAQQWILCEERMPEERGFYLVSGNGKVWICEMIILMGTKGWSNNIANPIVVAWMPLPKPWKESEE